MTSDRYRFGEFELDAADRRLTRAGVPVELSSRYLDALMLLVSEAGRLVSKDRFLDEVWKGIPVTDEALTQCIRSLRRALGDAAGRPRFIETEPKHGYRFIAEVKRGDGGVVDARASVEPTTSPAGDTPVPNGRWSGAMRLVVAGVAGGAAAGTIGGLIYGFIGAGDPLEPGLGSGSIVLVLTCVTILVAVTGAAGVSLGIAGADLLAGRPGPWRIVGGALGGMIVGAVVKMLGLDAFSLLLGEAPGGITGGGGGLVLGAAIGIGAWMSVRGAPSLRRSMAVAGLAGAFGGVAIGLMGGRLFAGSLDLLGRQFAESRLNLDGVARLLGEPEFGVVSRTVTGGLEGLLFGACMIGAMWLASARSR
ncbi:winged helix-turn-helix domain-containing protein [Brevundimonas aveniformis]|uniref:winged helix-turn-helix domain-containing protein n=1 Tax=Brevundimonas aveniformis TaxID=370977 RepID=UPI00248F7D84|nr:transcriptional regulator [Brevundimonas aveniformis]